MSAVKEKMNTGIFNRASLRYIRDGFRIGQGVRIKRRDGRGRDRYFKGVVIARTNYFITVRNKAKCRESFSYVDFLTRDVEVVS
ncbi:Veg family protein [Clostridium kluyveri]|uniref:Uncharacterized protein n=1 Tax=Clostridium kluyveri TaxID=1534 RepID=A0A1L5F8W5_CLOKL|nr:Veg family protein [Clostridium kluyveri]APM39422.1 hypothetical protein BS101_12050 [Clostridium kluyveri]